ncbi:MAG: hypothetical protein AAFO96_22070 [Bacteroidota bacterium]
MRTMGRHMHMRTMGRHMHMRTMGRHMHMRARHGGAPTGSIQEIF